ncbi:MAG: putative type 4 fimbrial biosis transrane protein [Herminiimonas sp.]|nr:putative type 4 fimbrial biosis transrane protein [Herminiimonas sp.]MDB5852074.1 putative type 4 fimbrial biosis transrane protein [Herminiimonas sp.]
MNVRSKRLVMDKSQSGFTLVELMVTVAIIGILAAIGYPSYTRYIVKANRSAAESYMLGVASQEERFILDARTYFCTVAGGCTNVLTATTGFTVPTEVSKNYSVSVAAPDTTTTAPTYTITATPVGGQLSRDTECKNLTLDQTGAKGINGGTSSIVSSCW